MISARGRGLRRAGFTDLKTTGTDFLAEAASSVREGLRRIRCGCAGPGRTCPNRLWRDEKENNRADTTVSRDMYETSRVDGTGHHSNTNGQEHLSMEASSSTQQRGDTVRDSVQHGGTGLGNSTQGDAKKAGLDHGNAEHSGDERGYVEQGNKAQVGRRRGAGQDGIALDSFETGGHEHVGSNDAVSGMAGLAKRASSVVG